MFCRTWYEIGHYTYVNDMLSKLKGSLKGSAKTSLVIAGNTNLGGGRLGTVDHLMVVACFVEKGK